MFSIEENVDKKSDYYVYTPSQQAKSTFLYPTCVGYFHYAPGYQLQRNNYDSYLLMYLLTGSCKFKCKTVQNETIQFTANEGDFVYINCHFPHEYATTGGFEAVWMHFDGICADGYDQMLQQNIFSSKNHHQAKNILWQIYQRFHESAPVNEGILSLQITEALTDLLQNNYQNTEKEQQTMENAITYMNDHFTEEISLKFLANYVHLSPFYFTRLFRKATGFTPHQYLISLRLNTAKYLLKTTKDSVKNICFTSGFPSESNFCKTFKEKEGITPSQYRLK